MRHNLNLVGNSSIYMQNLEYFYSVGFALAHPLIYLGNNRLKDLQQDPKL